MSYKGFHDYDEQLTLSNEQYSMQKLDFAKSWLEKLSALDFESLTEGEKIDYQIIENQLKASQFYIEEFRSFEWNPSSYNLGGAFFQVINYQKRDLNQRLTDVSTKLEAVPEYYQTATANLKEVTQVHTELAIQQLEGSKSMFETKLMDSLSASTHEAVFKLAFTEKSLRLASMNILF